MYNIYRIKVVIAIGFLITLVSCNQNYQDRQGTSSFEKAQSETQKTDTASLIKVGQGQSADGNLTTEIFAVDSLIDAYQELHLQLKDKKGRTVEKAKLELLPEMKMGMMAHTAPVVQPEGDADEKGFFHGAVVFIMPSSAESQHQWVINLLVNQQGASPNRINIPITVRQASKVRTVAFDGGNDGRFFLSFIAKDKVPVGSQALQFMLHTLNKNEFPAVYKGYEIALKMHMPNMNHRPEESEPARATGNGYYEGMVNFSMPGTWRIEATLLKDGKSISTEAITFELQVEK